MKISLCVTCMNRLKYLKQTIHKNLDYIKEFNSKNTDQYELSLCNYDSKDDLHDYIIFNFTEEIKSGLLNYLKIEDKEFFNASHAKNIAHKYSTGEFLINLDADNFVSYEILENFVSLVTKNDPQTIYIRDNSNIGLLGYSRNNFYKLGGYDERMDGYGYEDIDIRLRGFKFLKIDQVKLPSHINHRKDYSINQTAQEKTLNHEYTGSKTIENGYKSIDKWYDMLDMNRNMHKHNITHNIQNPNKFNNIEFGKI